MFQTIDTLNNAFTFIASAYIYLMAIAVLILFVQSIYAKPTQATSSDFYEQVKDLMTVEPEPNERRQKTQTKALVACNARLADIDFDKMNIRAIRDYVRTQSLQQLVKEAIGKSVSKCTLAELRSALMENQYIDRRFELVCDRI